MTLHAESAVPAPGPISRGPRPERAPLAGGGSDGGDGEPLAPSQPSVWANEELC